MSSTEETTKSSEESRQKKILDIDTASQLINIVEKYCRTLRIHTYDTLLSSIKEESGIDPWQIVVLKSNWDVAVTNFTIYPSIKKEVIENAQAIYDLMKLDPIRFYLPFLERYKKIALNPPLVVAEEEFLESLHLLQ